MRMTSNGLLSLNRASLQIVADIVGSDLAYISGDASCFTLTLMEHIEGYIAWEPLSLREAREVIAAYQPRNEVTRFSLSRHHWHQLFELLAEDILFLNHYDPDTPGNAGLSAAILTNDIFHCAADAESMSLSELSKVHQIWSTDSHHGVMRYVAEKRGYPPMKAYLKDLMAKGIDTQWAEALTGENK